MSISHLETFARMVKMFAIECDKEWGEYPEHKFEGLAFYEFVCQKCDIKPDDLEKERPEVYHV